ncbi:MAG: BtrH N-terminal domain-containing protein [Anaerolineae bacterium]
MTILPNYREFDGRHWETGTLRNALAYQGVKAPHTGKPMSEALLLGISGGITVGYFTFEYKGYLPHLALLTRNTFDPMDTMLDRVPLPREVRQTTDATKGEVNLMDALESGRPAIVWADTFTLHDIPNDAYWAMFPVVVYGLENGTAYLADRAACPIEIPAERLSKARARVGKDKFRLMVLDTPDLSRLPTAVQKGIWQCINLYTEAPPKGARHNFGLAALKHWAEMLTNIRNKQSWARFFAPGERMWMALAGTTVQPGAFGYINRGAGNSAERGMYADFLDEASVILQKPDLKQAADCFRRSEQLWAELADKLLPDSVPTFKTAKELFIQHRELYIERGAAVRPELRDIAQRLNGLQKEAEAKFPMTGVEITTLREGLAEQIIRIHDAERAAVETMQAAMG